VSAVGCTCHCGTPSNILWSEECTIQTLLIGDVGVIQEVAINLGQVAGSSWRPALAGVALASPYLSSWRLKLVAGTDAFGDQFVRAAGQAALGSSVKQVAKWTPAGYSAWQTSPTGVGLQHHTLTEPGDTTLVEEGPTAPVPQRCVIATSRLCTEKLLLAHQYLQAGCQEVVIVAESVSQQVFMAASPHLRGATWYLPEQQVSTLGFALTQHIGFMSAWADERASLGVGVLHGHGCDVVAVTHNGLAVSPALWPQKDHPLAQSGTPWRPAEDHYLLAFYMLAATYDERGVKRHPADVYRMAAAELAQGRRSWFEALNRQLLI